jgi:hypothetical protein
MCFVCRHEDKILLWQEQLSEACEIIYIYIRAYPANNN